MTFTKKIQDVLNKQINAEFYSSYIYLSMAAYFESTNLKGFANWMRSQVKEETEHGMKLFNYMLERGGEISLDKIEKPPEKWSSPLAAFEAALNHEKEVTGMINNLLETSRSEKDYATEVALHWFVTEQVEEESSVLEVVDKLKIIGDSAHALLLLDKQLGERNS